VSRDCEHDRLIHKHGTIWRCEDCEREIEMDAASFGGPDTVAEARGDK
jgi:ribosomal protein L37AE/L43A